MKYRDGQEVIIGDRVSLAEGSEGKVVFCVDRDEFSERYPKAEWGYLESGAMVKTEKFGLVHYPVADDELTLVSRG
jgi:hypothetical protein